MRVSICRCNKKTNEKCAHANYILRTHTTPPYSFSCHLPFAILKCRHKKYACETRLVGILHIFPYGMCLFVFPGCVVCSALYQYWSGRVETRYKMLTGCSLIFHPSPPTPSLHTLFLSFPASKHPYSSNSRTIIITFLKPHSFPSSSSPEKVETQRKGKICFLHFSRLPNHSFLRHRASVVFLSPWRYISQWEKK